MSEMEAQNVENSDSFQKVKTKSRKRKLVEDDGAVEKPMETAPATVKAPVLPPIAASRLAVSLDLIEFSNQESITDS